MILEMHEERDVSNLEDRQRDKSVDEGEMHFNMVTVVDEQISSHHPVFFLLHRGPCVPRLAAPLLQRMSMHFTFHYAWFFLSNEEVDPFSTSSASFPNLQSKPYEGLSIRF